MNPLCERCRGACCENWAVDVSDPRVKELVGGRTVGLAGQFALLACRCSHLTADGKCGVYEQRPHLCRTFQPLGEGCLRTLKAVRSELYAEVRGQVAL